MVWTYIQRWDKDEAMIKILQTTVLRWKAKRGRYNLRWRDLPVKEDMARNQMTTTESESESEMYLFESHKKFIQSNNDNI